MPVIPSFLVTIFEKCQRFGATTILVVDRPATFPHKVPRRNMANENRKERLWRPPCHSFKCRSLSGVVADMSIVMLWHSIRRCAKLPITWHGYTFITIFADIKCLCLLSFWVKTNKNECKNHFRLLVVDPVNFKTYSKQTVTFTVFIYRCSFTLIKCVGTLIVANFPIWISNWLRKNIA